MAYNRDQFERLIAQTLVDTKTYSRSAVVILLGTSAVESDFGTYLWQKGRGPAQGAFQMEPATFHDIVARRNGRYPELLTYQPEEMAWNLRLAIIMARLKYLDAHPALPDPDDIEAMANYWKTFYNSHLGAGKPEHFIEKYNRFVVGM